MSSTVQAEDYSQEDFFSGSFSLAGIDLEKSPRHVAIIMDGNRRWAKGKNLPVSLGHWEGAEVLSQIVRTASRMGVKTLTVYAFSTENWERPSQEIEDLMSLFELYLAREKDAMVRDGVRLDAIGDLSRLPEKVYGAFAEVKEATAACEKITLLLALNYGARDEICRAIRKIVGKGLLPEEITEECVRKHLDTAAYPDPELIIRTSGEMRMSNFLLFQASYAEFFSVDLLWPEFSSREFSKVLLAYQNRLRRLGG